VISASSAEVAAELTSCHEPLSWGERNGPRGVIACSGRSQAAVASMNMNELQKIGAEISLNSISSVVG
jgi:hypothetical protein